MAMRILIAGGYGMLGTAMRSVLDEAGIPHLAPSRSEFDIANPELVNARLADLAAALQAGERGVLVNAAAYTDVEGAETHREEAFRANESGARLLAESASEAGIAMVHVSTDFVFDGSKDTSYTERDEPNPLCVYGESKLAGEIAVLSVFPEALVVRTAWVFGPGATNFPLKIIELASTRDTLGVVEDEVGSPTYAPDLARGILGLLRIDASGLFHVAGAGFSSRFELAQEVLRLAGSSTGLEAVSSATLGQRVRRPANSVLDCSKAAALGVEMREWSASLAEYVGELEFGAEH